MSETVASLNGLQSACDLLHAQSLRDILHASFTSETSTRFELMTAADSLVGCLLRASTSTEMFVEELQQNQPLRRSISAKLTCDEMSQAGDGRWPELWKRLNGLESILDNSLSSLPDDLRAQAEVAQRNAASVSAGKPINGSREFGFECGLYVGIAIGLAATGGPVGMLLAVEVGGAAVQTCLG